MVSISLVSCPFHHEVVVHDEAAGDVDHRLADDRDTSNVVDSDRRRAVPICSEPGGLQPEHAGMALGVGEQVVAEAAVRREEVECAECERW